MTIDVLTFKIRKYHFSEVLWWNSSIHDMWPNKYAWVGGWRCRRQESPPRFILQINVFSALSFVVGLPPCGEHSLTSPQRTICPESWRGFSCDLRVTLGRYAWEDDKNRLWAIRYVDKLQASCCLTISSNWDEGRSSTGAKMNFRVISGIEKDHGRIIGSTSFMMVNTCVCVSEMSWKGAS